MNEKQPNSVLILGRADMGKTIYGGQFLGRILYPSGESRLRRRGALDTLENFKHVLDSLSSGVLPDHTSREVYHETLLPLSTISGEPIDLFWPDYGGEQIDDIVSHRALAPSWLERVAESDAWLLFLRLSKVRIPEDALERRAAIQEQTGARPGTLVADLGTQGLSDQAVLVELLQMLLHARTVSQKGRAKPPVLGVALTAIDEIVLPAEHVQPPLLLEERLPLLADYLASTWRAEQWFVIGLSALGKELNENVADETFVTEGPETQGEVILPDGTRSSDLTLPVALLVDRLQ